MGEVAESLLSSIMLAVFFSLVVEFFCYFSYLKTKFYVFLNLYIYFLYYEMFFEIMVDLICYFDRGEKGKGGGENKRVKLKSSFEVKLKSAV